MDTAKYMMITIIWTFLFSCKNTGKDNSISMNNPGRPLSELKELALLKGDTNAYEKLSIAYLDLPSIDFIPIAIEMADKYDYSQAYFDVFVAFMDSENMWVDDIEKWEKLNDSIKYFALRYLLLGAERKHHQSLDIIQDDFTRGKELNKYIINDSRLVSEFKTQLDNLNVSRLKILILPPYDKIANRGISPNIQEYLETLFEQNENYELIKFPYKKLMNIPYQNVYDKKYTEPILDSIYSDFLIMSKLDFQEQTGKMNTDKWGFSLKIFDVVNDTQWVSLRGSDMTSSEIQLYLKNNIKNFIKNNN